MAKFSQRYGHTPLEQAFQREAVDSRLRTSLWNVLNLCVWERWEPYEYGSTPDSQRINALLKRVWFHYFKGDIDKLPTFRGDYSGSQGAYDILKDYFFKAKWYEVY